MIPSISDARSKIRKKCVATFTKYIYHKKNMDLLASIKDEESQSLLKQAHQPIIDEQGKSMKVRKLMLHVLFLTVGAFFAIIFATILVKHNTSTAIRPGVQFCGSTPDEARANECKFQLWGFSWVPNSCYDPEIEREYLEAQSWSFYLDGEGKQEVNISEAQSGNYALYTTKGQHYWHCYFTLRKLITAITIDGSGVGLTNAEIGPQAFHMQHCLNTIQERNEARWHEMINLLEPNYYWCYERTIGHHLDILPSYRLPETDYVGRILPGEDWQNS
jgi:hypothetical protein